MYTKIIYENLRVEMTKKRIRVKDIADAIHMSESWLYKKLIGKSRFYLHEAMEIQRTCFPDCDMEYLFEK